MSDSAKSVDDILSLSDEDYTAYISDLLKDEGAIWELDELDDGLLKIVGERPTDVERICRINLTVFGKIAEEDVRTFLLAYNFNTLMGALIYQNKISEAKSIFREGLAFCRTNKHYEAGKSLSENIFRRWASAQMPVDEAPFFLTQITEFFNSLGKYEDAMGALRAAALYFADAAAYQSAYRALHDAQEIAMGHKMLRSQAKNMETQGMVALIEEDLLCAEDEFKKCFEIYKHIGEAPPFELKANAALVKSRNEDYKEARDIYQTLADEYPEVEYPNAALLRLNGMRLISSATHSQHYSISG